MSDPVKALYRIVAAHEMNRPRAWIARAEGISVSDVTTVLRVAGIRATDTTPLDTYDAMERMVREGTSQREILRTLGSDRRTLMRWFPEAGLKRGSPEHQSTIRMVASMKKLEGGYS